MAKLSQNQQNYIFSLLKSDISGNHQLLSHYLKLIIANRHLQLEVPGVPPTDKHLDLNAQELWDVINTWKDESGVSLPMGDRGSRKLKATKLLNYLDLIQSSTREAASNWESIKESASSLQYATPQSREGRELKKTLDLRTLKLQIEIHNKQVLGQLSDQISRTKLLSKFAGDPQTQRTISSLFAANANNLRTPVDNLALADEITKLVQLNSSRSPNFNHISSLAYSDSSQVAGGELDELRTILTNSNFDSRSLSYTSHLLSIADIPTILEMYAGGASATTRQKLSSALKQTIIQSTNLEYQHGSDIFHQALQLAGLPTSGSEIDNLKPLFPFLEEIRTVELHNTVWGDVLENDPRIQASHSFSSILQISPHIPWLSQKGLDLSKQKLIDKYGADLEKSLQFELTQGEKANFAKISEIRQYYSNQSQFNHYKSETGSFINNPGYYLWNSFVKARGNIAGATHPIRRFYQKIDDGMYHYYETLMKPFDLVADLIESKKEKNIWWNLLTPGQFVGEQLIKLQKSIALSVYKWSAKLASKHPKNLFYQEISLFSKLFFKNEADFQGAGFHYLQVKWGDLLNFGARKAGFTGLDAVRAKIGSSMWEGFKKMAPGLAEKLSAGSLGKLVASLIAGELSAGTTLLLQLGLMIVGNVLKKVWSWFTEPGKFGEFVSKIPIYALAGSIIALPGMIVGGLAAIGTALLGILAGAGSMLFTTVLLPALIVVGSYIGITTLLDDANYIGFHLDSGLTQLVTSLVCDQSTQTTGNKTANVALCIADLAYKCPGLNPMTESVLASPKWQCFIGQFIYKEAIAELEKSSHVKNSDSAKEGNVQCVGGSSAAAASGDGAFSVGQINACQYAHNVPKGYRYISGCPNPQPGDHFIMKADDCSGYGGKSVGHIGIIIEPAGSGAFKCVDVNAVVPGQVRGPDKCGYGLSEISGCLRKM